MSRFSLWAQVVAVVSRRTPAFEPATEQPRTFSSRVRAWTRRNTASHRTDIPSAQQAVSPPDEASGISIDVTDEPTKVPLEQNLEGFETFYRQTAPGLVRFLILQGAALPDAADITQDTMVEVWRRWHKLDHPRVWAHRVASRSLIRRTSELHNNPISVGKEHSPLLRASPTEAWHIRHDLIDALAMLPLRQRQVMAWTLSEYTPTEIAKELNLPNDQVRANLRLARRALAARLTKRDTEETQSAEVEEVEKEVEEVDAELAKVIDLHKIRWPKRGTIRVADDTPVNSTDFMGRRAE